MFEVDDADEIGNVLTSAVKSQNIDRVRAALESGAQPDDPEALDNNNMSPLCQAIGDAQDVGWKIVHLLIEAGASPNGFPEADKTPLETAAFYGESELARVLVLLGADINARGGEGTPLEVALRERQDDAALVLLALGALGRELAPGITDADIQERKREILESEHIGGVRRTTRASHTKRRAIGTASKANL
ncbi:MAG TPA: ankyrin repeat domain-containing protein [Hyphomonadaceae bacterium]|nr:ankyrin repeat domain-containing protein [Hyphomonadaceae bacterium]